MDQLFLKFEELTVSDRILISIEALKAEKVFYRLREVQHFQSFRAMGGKKTMKIENSKEAEAMLCSNCQCEIENEQYVGEEGDIFCEKCFYDFYCTCDICGDVVKLSDSYYSDLELKTYCLKCKEVELDFCEDCGDELDENSVFCPSDGEAFCENCFYQRYDYCSYCGEPFEIDELSYIENEGYRCNSCCSRYSSEFIREYEYKPDPEFKITRSKERHKKNTLFFGLELEVENTDKQMDNDSMAEEVDNYIDGAYCKKDASLKTGFEIVTHPFTWQWYKDEKENFDNLLDALQSNGFSSYEPGTCGIHIHISKNCFSTIHLYKFLKMFYDCKNYPLIYSISQRSPNSTKDGSQWGKQENIDTSLQINFAKDKTSSNRYTAVNLENPDTAEVRIFRGTLNKVSFHKNLEFVKALFEFTLEFGIKDCTWANFSSYVKANSLIFTNLFKFMEKKKLFL